jgi:hypothetical protein
MAEPPDGKYSLGLCIKTNNTVQIKQGKGNTVIINFFKKLQK